VRGSTTCSNLGVHATGNSLRSCPPTAFLLVLSPKACPTSPRATGYLPNPAPVIRQQACACDPAPAARHAERVARGGPACQATYRAHQPLAGRGG
jgi:hypothetical protein